MTYKGDIPKAVRRLMDRGVAIPCPLSVEIDEAVNPDRIAPGVTIHTGCKVLGKSTSMGPGCRIGGETPATVQDCQLGHDVELKGGFFSGATFLDGSSMGSGAHVRSGTLLEEEASGAHAVGFKQTILFPFVTAGSLINFCDCLMAGGTNRKNHSEIGSSYIHFNFTPRGDKATASLIGDVPRGVFLRQPPIFLGGQGGLVGPARVGYGVLIPAGAVLRKDALEENCLHPASGGPTEGPPRPYDMERYQSINRVVRNNLIYIGNIKALKEWYRQVRVRFLSSDAYRKACWEGALIRLDEIRTERLKRLGQLAEKLGASLERASGARGVDPETEPFRGQRDFCDQWPRMESFMREDAAETAAEQRDSFLQAWSKTDPSDGYMHAIQSLDDAVREAGTAWLQAVVDTTVSIWQADRPA